MVKDIGECEEGEGRGGRTGEEEGRGGRSKRRKGVEVGRKGEGMRKALCKLRGKGKRKG